MELPDRGKDDQSPDWHVVVILALIAIIVFGVVAWALYPGTLLTFRHNLATLASDTPSVASAPENAKPLYLAEPDARFMNRILKERSDEVAYCGLITDQRTIRPWLADSSTSNESSVTFNFQNCPTDQYTAVAFLHTHPTGIAYPSQQDRALLRRTPKIAYMCIQNGPIRETDGRATNMHCYTPTPDGSDLQKIPIRVVDCRTCRNNRTYVSGGQPEPYALPGPLSSSTVSRFHHGASFRERTHRTDSYSDVTPQIMARPAQITSTAT